MSVSSEVHVGVAQCLDAIKQAFDDGGAIIEKIKRKRALKRAPPPPRLLEESIDQAPHEIEKEKQRGLNRFGQAFEDGDAIAVITLQQICIQLQSSLLEKLRNAAFDDDHAITDFTYLVDAADVGRDKAIAALHEFKQRLLSAQTFDQEADADEVAAKEKSVKSISPDSSKTSIVTAPVEPARRDTIRPTPPEPTRSQTFQPNSQTKPEAPPRHHKTWSRDFTQSAEASGEDATSGAEEPAQQSHHRKRSSLLHFLKHNRTHSSEVKDTRQGSTIPVAITEEPVRQPSASGPTSAPSQPAPQRGTSQEHVPQQPFTKFRYEEWEDNPEEIWGSKPSLDRRETVAVAPDQARDSSSVHSGSAGGPLLAPPVSPVMTHRTNSIPQHSTTIITPNPENEFLGFCKGAWKLQNGDRKGAMSKKSEVDPWSRHPSANAAQYLSCLQPKCAFRSSFANVNMDVMWNKVFIFEAKGLKLRWPFLAKSHVQQKVVVKHQYSFKCLFCVFLGAQSGVYHGMDYYLDHIVNEHRGRALGDVVLYKSGCINDRIADDKEEFDINLFPMTLDNTKEKTRPEYLSDDPMDPHWAKSDANDSMFSANEPWNEGLSDFHYRIDDRYGAELE